MSKPKKKKVEKKKKAVKRGTSAGLEAWARSRKTKKQITGVQKTSIASNYGVMVPGQKISFSKGRNTQCMRASFRQYIGEIGYTTTGNTYFNIVNTTLATNNLGGQWYFNPANSQYLSGLPFFQLCAFFEKYYLHSLSLDLYSNVGSNTSGVITCGSIDEPGFFETSGVATATTTPSATLITQMYRGMSCPVWTPSVHVPAKTDPRQMYYVRGPDGTATTYGFGDDIAQQRQCYSHVFGFRVSLPALPASDTAIFQVYMNVDIELCDFATNYSTAPVFSKTFSRRLKDLEGKVKEIDEDKMLDVRCKERFVQLDIDSPVSVSGARKSSRK